MSHIEAEAGGPHTGSMSEKNASKSAENDATSTQTHSHKPTKQRSCVVCRSRKVRCDRQSPCSNCSRAKIPCVFPPTDRPPRWARRLNQSVLANSSASSVPSPRDANPDHIMERVRYLESLVKDLSGQLEQANAAASPKASSSDAIDTSTSKVQEQFGRLVIQDANRSRYVSSGFWSRVNDELGGIDDDNTYTSEEGSETEASPGKSLSTQELDRTPSERHAFLFQHNLYHSSHDLREYHPLPSQVPFLLDIFSENINSISRIVHMPTITKMVRDVRSNGKDMSSLTPANEALMFSIYYAAITSMDEGDIITNFGSNKTDLNLRYRLGLELALAKADFLNVPDLVLVQALSIFLFLLRRHDSPRFVWMMTGLVIRMGQALGLQRDGSHFDHLSPYDIEMRRRTWWGLYMLDARASEDQGMDYSISRNNFDTKLPLNINDVDIWPEMTKPPTAREGITDVTFSLVQCEITEIAGQMMQKIKEGTSAMEEQNGFLDEIYQTLERRYLRYAVGSEAITYWVGVTIVRLVMAKMTLLVYLPILFSRQTEDFSDAIRSKLLVAAIEVAEYNHALNAEQRCRHWRWVYQVYTHWHAIVYLLIEISRRPWSPIVERAWVALHSPWLIPAQSQMDKNMRFWVPLRRLMARARRHREVELDRMSNDAQAAQQLEQDGVNIPTPASPGPFLAGSDVVGLFQHRWRQLLATPRAERTKQKKTSPGPAAPQTTIQHSSNLMPTYSAEVLSTAPNPGVNASFDPGLLNYDSHPSHNNIPTTSSSSSNTPSISTTTQYPIDFASTGRHTAAGEEPSHNAVASTWSTSTNAGLTHWLWADTDPNVDVFANVDLDFNMSGAVDAAAADMNMHMDMGSDVDWYTWVESAKGMELS